MWPVLVRVRLKGATVAPRENLTRTAILSDSNREWQHSFSLVCPTVVQQCHRDTMVKASYLCLPWKSCCTSTGGTVCFTFLPTSSSLLTKVRVLHHFKKNTSYPKFFTDLPFFFLLWTPPFRFLLALPTNCFGMGSFFHFLVRHR